MISLSSLYRVVEAMVPLYVAMVLGYISARRKAFTAEQCAGINHFVALFAIPLLIFHLLATNNPYQMNLRFLAADTLQKVIVLILTVLWACFSSHGSLEWVITLFSLATLPNLVIIGIPLLGGMYGNVSEGLMVQMVVMQFVIWFVVVVFLFECLNARKVIENQQNSRVNSMELPVTNSNESGVKSKLSSVRQILVTVLKKVFKIPSTYSTLLGILWSLISFRYNVAFPTIIDKSLSIISTSTIGLSMFSVGTFMARQNKFIACGYSAGFCAMITKFIGGPVIMAAASYAVGLHGVVLRVGIVQAALPVAVLCFVYAEEYHVHPEILSTSVILGILMSVPITIVYYIILD